MTAMDLSLNMIACASERANEFEETTVSLSSFYESNIVITHNGYSAKVITVPFYEVGSLAVDGCAVTFGTARTGLGGAAARSGPSSARSGPSSLYQM